MDKVPASARRLCQNKKELEGVMVWCGHGMSKGWVICASWGSRSQDEKGQEKSARVCQLINVKYVSVGRRKVRD